MKMQFPALNFNSMHQKWQKRIKKEYILELWCNFRLSLFVCWCLIVDAGQKIRPLRRSWTNSEINNPLWEWDHKPKQHNVILWPYLRLQCWPNWFKALPIIANNILAWEIFQGTNRMFSLVGHLSVSSQSRKGSCASKPLFSQAMGQDCRFIRYLYCVQQG